MTIPPPSERIAAYRKCEAELGSCYCYLNAMGYCYRGPLDLPPAAKPRGALAAAVAAVGVLIWPLGPVAWWLAWRALEDAPGPGHKGFGMARGARVLGGAESIWLMYVAMIICFHYA